MDPHDQIAKFLENQQVLSLSHHRSLLPPERYTKAGILPFIKQASGTQYYLMKPRAAQPDLPPPDFQLGKGTRMMFTESNSWRDMREGETARGNCETLLQTALREGIEELGLKLENIARLYEMGGYDFSSARTGKGKQVWLFAAEVIDADDFSGTEASTAARRWMSMIEFAAEGRIDHRHILESIDRALHAPR